MKNSAKSRFPASPRIIFMGTPDFSVPSLRALVERGHDVSAVVTQPDRPKGRGKKLMPSPVKEAAVELGLHVLQPEKASAGNSVAAISEMNPDLYVVVAFGQVLKLELLDVPHYGALNIHASLLPRYRGAAPIQWAILNDDEKTGLTAMWMDEGLDTGPILLQEEVPILEGETAGHLHDRLAALSAGCILRTLSGLADMTLKETPQNDALATYAPKIDKGMAHVEWGKPAKALAALLRALDPWPGGFTTIGGSPIKLFSVQYKGVPRTDFQPGRIAGFSEGAIEIETADGLLVVREVQVPGKRRLSVPEFLRGFPLKKGTVLGA